MKMLTIVALLLAVAIPATTTLAHVPFGSKDNPLNIPNGGYVFTLTKPFNITWKPTTSTAITVALLYNNSDPRVLGRTPTNTGSIESILSPDLPLGDNYNVALFQGNQTDTADDYALATVIQASNSGAKASVSTSITSTVSAGMSSAAISSLPIEVAPPRSDGSMSTNTTANISVGISNASAPTVTAGPSQTFLTSKTVSSKTGSMPFDTSLATVKSEPDGSANNFGISTVNLGIGLGVPLGFLIGAIIAFTLHRLHKRRNRLRMEKLQPVRRAERLDMVRLWDIDKTEIATVDSETIEKLRSVYELAGKNLPPCLTELKGEDVACELPDRRFSL